MNRSIGFLRNLCSILSRESTKMAGKANAKEFVDAKIKGKKVVVFSKSYCPYCIKAKSVLNSYIDKGLDKDDMEIIEIENDPNCNAIQDVLADITGARSVPRVFINQKFIGGGDETQQKHKLGEIKKLLDA